MEIDDADEKVALRPVFSEIGQLSRPDGSASFCQGETIVTSAVYGPTEVRIQKELDSQANVEVVFRPKTGLAGCSEKFLEHIVKNTCKSVILTTHYPRSSITIVLQEMQNAGSLLMCCVNAACLALVNAGLDMKCLLAAVSCIINENEEIVLDPTSSQEKDARASMFFTFDSQTYYLVSSYAEGIFSRIKYEECISVCRDASKKICDFYRDAVSRKCSKS